VDAGADGDSYVCTLLAVGELHDDGKEGGFYHIGQLGRNDNAATATAAAGDGATTKISRKKAYQLLAHALALESTANQALIAYEYPAAALEAISTPSAKGEFAARDDDGNELVDEFVNAKMESRMIQAMREENFEQLMELDVLVGKGLEAYKDFIENPPRKENASQLSSVKSTRDEQDAKIMAILEGQAAEEDAARTAEFDRKKAVVVKGIAQEWSIKEYSLRMLAGDLDDSITEKEFMISVNEEALAQADETFDRINSEEYQEEQYLKARAKVEQDSANKLFYDGMPSLLRKKREKMVENVKKQYMDLLSEEDLESIILNE